MSLEEYPEDLACAPTSYLKIVVACLLALYLVGMLNTISRYFRRDAIPDHDTMETNIETRQASAKDFTMQLLLIIASLSSSKPKRIISLSTDTRNYV
jgi:hypothetical protein